MVLRPISLAIVLEWTVFLKVECMCIPHLGTFAKMWFLFSRTTELKFCISNICCDATGPRVKPLQEKSAKLYLDCFSWGLEECQSWSHDLKKALPTLCTPGPGTTHTQGYTNGPQDKQKNPGLKFVFSGPVLYT